MTNRLSDVDRINGCNVRPRADALTTAGLGNVLAFSSTGQYAGASCKEGSRAMSDASPGQHRQLLWIGLAGGLAAVLWVVAIGVMALATPPPRPLGPGAGGPPPPGPVEMVIVLVALACTATLITAVLGIDYRRQSQDVDHEARARNAVMGALTDVAVRVERMSARVTDLSARREALAARVEHLMADGGRRKLDQSEYYQVYADVLMDLAGVDPGSEPSQ
jgi:hypothetical protein